VLRRTDGGPSESKLAVDRGECKGAVDENFLLINVIKPERVIKGFVTIRMPGFGACIFQRSNRHQTTVRGIGPQIVA